MTTTTSKFIALGIAVAIFVAGGISGFAIGRHKAPTSATEVSQARAGKLPRIDRFAKRFQLTGEQRTKIEAIMVRAGNEVRTSRAEAERAIRAVLEPQQLERYERMLERRKARRAKRGKKGKRGKRNKRGKR